ncbi:acetyl-CoA carboxylase biotin carboxyl carrier protein subunit [Mesorhizobium plurifarium]|uniref:acetyl-CoA carboxylase biotin carboxyl carrier protein subunit n=1 Tax=Sinorhizobium arboris TaxID=76745 RepID=UPI000518EF2B|nr:acetyl-CoA carboxylase biotin carboxyl carrier protein subunit [Sinorhizobium arboris]PST20779.1 acetyl-CoA carboxylase biotin carboxyl carrier protein subunit [Mesorhizobium plurifarium]
MNHVFELEGVDYQLWLSRWQQGYRLHFGDEVLASLDLSLHGDGCGLLTIAGASEPVRFAIDGDTIHLHIRGTTRILRYRDPLSAHGLVNKDAGHLVARAPMPGVVVKTCVLPGDQISAGSELMVIESMKLESVIRSPQDGVVDRIHFNEGESFEHGAALITITEEGH